MKKMVALSSGSYKSGLTALRAVPLTMQLAKRNWDISLIVPGVDKHNNFTADPKAYIPGVNLIQPWQLKSKSTILNLIPYMFTSLWSVIKERPDLIYMFKPTPANILAVLPAMIWKVPLIVDLDDLGGEVMRQQRQSRLQAKLVDYCESWAIKKADSVVVASSYLKQKVSDKHPNKRVIVLSNGVDPNDYKMPKVQKPRPAIYYFGALNRLSLLETFIEALPMTLDSIPKANVTIIGGGQDLQKARDLVMSLGIASQVIFTDWIKPLAIKDYVHYGDIGVCMQPDTTSVRAASNIKVFQYMSLGSVPVVSKVGDLAEYVGASLGSKAAGVAVTAGDVSSLSQTLIGLLEDPAKRFKMAKLGRMRAEELYSWSVLVDTLDQFLTEFLKNDVSMKSTREISHV